MSDFYRIPVVLIRNVGGDIATLSPQNRRKRFHTVNIFIADDGGGFIRIRIPTKNVI